MQKMKYQPERTYVVLDKGEFKGFEYKIISYGTHPCCYVAIPEGHNFYNKHYEDIDIECHGGVTYSEKEEDGKYWVGWDYAHLGDYVGIYEMDILKDYIHLHTNEKKWMTKELKEEVEEFIEKLQV